MDTVTLSPDGFPLPANDPQIEAHQLLSAFMEQTQHLSSTYKFRAQDYSHGISILAQSPSENILMVNAALRRFEWLLRDYEDLPRDKWDLSNMFPRSWMLSPKRHHADSLSIVLSALFKRKLPLSSTDAKQIIQVYVDLFRLDSDHPRPWVLRRDFPLSGMLRNFEWCFSDTEIDQNSRQLLQKFHLILARGGNSDKEDDTLAVRVEKLLGSKFDSEPEPGESWADAALSELVNIDPNLRTSWGALFAHAVTASSGKPSAKWLAEAANHCVVIGPESISRHLATWLAQADAPTPFLGIAPYYEGRGVEDVTAYREQHQSAYKKYTDAKKSHISDRNVILLKGLTWYASLCSAPDLARAAGHVTQAAYATVEGYGTYSSKLGNAGIWALGQMPGGVGVGPLAMLRTKLRDRGALKLIAAAIESAAKASGMTVDELEDLAVPTGGLDADGTRTETFGAEGSARLTLDGATGRTKLEWFGADGKPRKAVPAGVKREYAAEVKAFKAAEEEVAAAVSAQAARFDRALLEERTLTLGVWRERYGSHPVLGNLARRLIWTVGGKAVLPVGEGFADVSGLAMTGLSDEAEIKLWHPINAEPKEVLRWRDALETRQLVQPFKQAHREVYLLTDAERTTATYSNRFAAHILKQHQFNSLCVLRGWKNTLRLMVDDSYPPATRALPRFGLRAEFWVEGIGDNYGTDTNDAGTYLRVATDQVRFYREFAETNSAHASGGGYAPGRNNTSDPILLSDVPPLAFSEIMRDVDLFVGVASVGNDPAWADGGPEGRFRDYWQDYAFGELGETAKTRTAVLATLLPRLKIASRCGLDGKFLVVRGDVRTYKIHLGSGSILMEPNDQYLCIVPGRSEDTGDVFLPFEGDRVLAIILSKAFLLADDTKIADPTITRQIRLFST